MVLIFRGFLASLGMTDSEGNIKGKMRRFAMELNIRNNFEHANRRIFPLIINIYPVIPIEADEGGVVRNLLLY